MIIENKIFLSITLFTALTFSTLTNAQTLSEEIFKNVAGKRIWQVQVNCDSANPSQVLNKAVTSDQWCINDSTDCYTDKQLAAEKACNKSVQTNETPKVTPPAPSAGVALDDDEEDDDDYDGDEKIIDYDALRKEKLELEASRLTIQQEILELKRQEIELQKSTILN